MAYGFQVTNSSGQVLIDSDLFHYHFIGSFTPYTSVVVPDINYGPKWSMEHGPNDNKGMENMPSKGRIYKYSIPANGDKPPMCFIKPGYTGSTAPYEGIILTARNGSSWDVWVFQGPKTSLFSSVKQPVLYCFSPLDQIADNAPSSYGLQTYNTSGSRTFDSRYRPLRIVGAGDISVPTLAHTGSTGSGWTCSLDVNCAPLSSNFTNQPYVSDLIYYAPSLAHACQQYQYSASKSGIADWERYSWSRTDLWWCFYRSGYRLTDAQTMQSSYAVYARGHVYDYNEDSSSIIVAILVGAITGGAYFAIALGALVATGIFTNSGVAAGGYLPYANGSRNVGSNPYLISRASFYPSLHA
jgi:hypothetical protein